MIYSQWVTKQESDWDWQGQIYPHTDIAAPAVTQNILDSGVILVYMECPEYPDNTPVQLPFQHDADSLHFDFYDFVGDISIRCWMPTTSVVTFIPTTLYRYILIPASVLAATGTLPKDYNSVAARFHIPAGQ